MKHYQPPRYGKPAVSPILTILIVSHAIVFGWGVLIGAWVW